MKKWIKKIPDQEGLWIRQCAAKGHNELQVVTKWIYVNGEEDLKTDWGWSDDRKPVSLKLSNDSSDVNSRNNMKHFYWYGPIELPPESNLCIVVKEGTR